MQINTSYTFEWSPEKANTNLQKHGVSFEEAASIFLDPNQISIYDNEHSGKEDRWITLGISEKGKLVVVCHTFLESREKKQIVIRIFSSRKATRKETNQYKQG